MRFAGFNSPRFDNRRLWDRSGRESWNSSRAKSTGAYRSIVRRVLSLAYLQSQRRYIDNKNHRRGRREVCVKFTSLDSRAETSMKLLATSWAKLDQPIGTRPERGNYVGRGVKISGDSRCFLRILHYQVRFCLNARAFNVARANSNI